MKPIRECECPNCGKKGFLNRIINYKKNYPFGRKSKARIKPKVVKYFCNYKEETRQGYIKFECQSIFCFWLHNGGEDNIGDVV